MSKTPLRLLPLLQYAAAVLRGSPAFHQRHLLQALRARLGGESPLGAGCAPHRLLEAAAGADIRSTAVSAVQHATANSATQNRRAIWTQCKVFGDAAAAQASQSGVVNSSSGVGACQRSAHTRRTDGLGQGEQSTAKQHALSQDQSDRLTSAAFAGYVYIKAQGAPLKWTWNSYSFGPRLVILALAVLCSKICTCSRNEC